MGGVRTEQIILPRNFFHNRWQRNETRCTGKSGIKSILGCLKTEEGTVRLHEVVERRKRTGQREADGKGDVLQEARRGEARRGRSPSVVSQTVLSSQSHVAALTPQ